MRQALSFSDGYMMSPRRQAGVSLIEVMIGMTLGLITVLIMTQAFSVNDAARRSTASASDSVQIGALASHYLNADLQDAGSGMVRGGNVWGCELNVSVGGKAVLPRSTAFPAPFSAVPLRLRAAPVVVFDGGSGSDVVMVMAGNSMSANRDFPFSRTGDGKLVFKNPVGFLPNDMLLAVGREASLGMATCDMVQVHADYKPSGDSTPTESYSTLGLTAIKPANDTIPLSTAYGGVSDTVAAKSPSVQNLGDSPVIAFYGVNSNNELIRYNVLEGTTTVLAENIFLFKALLGIDTDDTARQNPDAVGHYAINEWKAPDDAAWTASVLLGGDTAAARKLDLILALRIALVVQSSVPSQSESKDFALFANDNANKIDVTLSGTDKRRRFSVNELTVPLRNMRSAYRGG